MKPIIKQYVVHQSQSAYPGRIVWACTKDEENPDNMGKQQFEINPYGNAANHPKGSIATITFQNGKIVKTELQEPK